MTQAEQQALKVDVVIPLIKESGKPITLVSPSTEDTGTDYVPGEGFTTPSVPIESYGFGVETEADESTVTETVISQTVKTLMCVEIPKPRPKIDSMIVDTTTYSIIHVEELAPGNVSFMYTVYLGA